MELIETQELKKKVNQDINRLLDDFTRQTGLTITNIDFDWADITRLFNAGLRNEYLYNVEIEVKL